MGCGLRIHAALGVESKMGAAALVVDVAGGVDTLFLSERDHACYQAHTKLLDENEITELSGNPSLPLAVRRVLRAAIDLFVFTGMSWIGQRPSTIAAMTFADIKLSINKKGEADAVIGAAFLKGDYDCEVSTLPHSGFNTDTQVRGRKRASHKRLFNT